MIIIYILTGIAFALVLVTLVMGAAGMGSKKPGAKERSNKWMARRVMAQGFAILMLVILVSARAKSGG